MELCWSAWVRQASNCCRYYNAQPDFDTSISPNPRFDCKSIILSAPGLFRLVSSSSKKPCSRVGRTRRAYLVRIGIGFKIRIRGRHGIHILTLDRSPFLYNMCYSESRSEFGFVVYIPTEKIRVLRFTGLIVHPSLNHFRRVWVGTGAPLV